MFEPQLFPSRGLAYVREITDIAERTSCCALSICLAGSFGRATPALISSGARESSLAGSHRLRLQQGRRQRNRSARDRPSRAPEIILAIRLRPGNRSKVV